MNGFAGGFRAGERRLIVLAALVLLPVLFLPVLPIWQIRMWAPQYREGLVLTIYTNDLRGDVDKVNTLNHYVGMKPIRAADFDEFGYMPQALTGFGLLALLAALFNRRWFAIAGWLAFTAFSAWMFGQYWEWLWKYGHELDPRAAITLPAFMPPVVGYSKMANFKVLSLPHVGTLLLGVAWALGPIVLWLERRDARRSGAARSAASAVAGASVLLFVAAFPAPAAAVRIDATPGGASLTSALSAASPGDTVVAGAGVHRGSFRIDRAIHLVGAPGAVLDGGGRGSVLTVAAPGTVVSDLAVRGSGARVLTVDAAVHVFRAGGVTLSRLVVTDALYGVYGERSPGLRVEDCTLTGRVPPLREDGEGNGIHLWYSDEARIERNAIARFVDGVYLSFVHRASLADNRFADSGRYGLHTMYCHDMELSGNDFAKSVAGCAIMFSSHLKVRGNDFRANRGPRTYGLLLRDCSAGTFEDNRFFDNTIAIFFDNSNRNRFAGNLIQDNGWGVLLFASCANNEFSGNAFVHDDYPVALDMRRTNNRFDDGARGNYWSEARPYDLDGDGVADAPHAPVDAFSFLSKRYPDLSVLARSPAVAALGVAERVLPALRPSDALDRFPLRRPPRVRGTGRPLARAATTGSSGGAALAYAALGVFGAAGLAPLGALARGRRTGSRRSA